MKNGRHPIRFIPILCVFAIIAIFPVYSCDEDNGDGDSKTPEITNVMVIKKSAPDDPIDPSSSDEPIVVYVAEELKYRVDYIDRDLDANLLQFDRYHPSSESEPFIGEYVELPEQDAAETSYEPDEYGFFGAFLGKWRLVFVVNDEKGHASEPFELLVEVKEPEIVPQVEPPDEQCDGDQPVINKASFFLINDPDSPIEPNDDDEIEVYQNEYFIWQVEYSDEDRDVKHLQVSSFHPSYELTPSHSYTYRIHQVKMDDSYRHPDPSFFGGDPGLWRVEFVLEDECRLRSDAYAVWVNVLSP